MHLAGPYVPARDPGPYTPPPQGSDGGLFITIFVAVLVVGVIVALVKLAGRGGPEVPRASARRRRK